MLVTSTGRTLRNDELAAEHLEIGDLLTVTGYEINQATGRSKRPTFHVPLGHVLEWWDPDGC